jgi:hypothetical protein
VGKGREMAIDMVYPVCMGVLLGVGKEVGILDRKINGCKSPLHIWLQLDQEVNTESQRII